MNGDPGGLLDGMRGTRRPSGEASGCVVPWFDGASPTRSSTFAPPPRNFM